MNISVPELLDDREDNSQHTNIVTRWIGNVEAGWALDHVVEDPILRAAQMAILLRSEIQVHQFGTQPQVAFNLPYHYKARKNPDGQVEEVSEYDVVELARRFDYHSLPLVIDSEHPKKIMENSLEIMAATTAQLISGFFIVGFPLTTTKPSSLRAFRLPPALRKVDDLERNFRPSPFKRITPIFSNTGSKLTNNKLEFTIQASKSHYEQVESRQNHTGMRIPGYGQRFGRNENHRDHTVSQDRVVGTSGPLTSRPTNDEQETPVFEVKMEDSTVSTPYPISPFIKRTLELKEALIKRAQGINFRANSDIPPYIYKGPMSPVKRCFFTEKFLDEIVKVTDQDTWLTFIKIMGRSHILTPPQAQKLTLMVQEACNIALPSLADVVRAFWENTNFRILFSDLSDWQFRKEEEAPKGTPVQQLIQLMDQFVVQSTENTKLLHQGRLARWESKSIAQPGPSRIHKMPRATEQEPPANLVRPPSIIKTGYKEKNPKPVPQVDWEDYLPPQADANQISTKDAQENQKAREADAQKAATIEQEHQEVECSLSTSVTCAFDNPTLQFERISLEPAEHSFKKVN